MACGRMGSEEDVAIERGHLCKTGAIGSEISRMISEAIIIAAGGGQAVGIDDLPAHAAVAAGPGPSQRAGRVSRGGQCSPEKVAKPPVFAVLDDASAQCRGEP